MSRQKGEGKGVCKCTWVQKSMFISIGELASTIVHRNSIGHETTMSIDQRLAVSKQQREEAPQNELMIALKKRKVSVEQSGHVPEKATLTTEVRDPAEKEPVVENINLTTGSSQEDQKVSTIYIFNTHSILSKSCLLETTSFSLL